MNYLEAAADSLRSYERSDSAVLHERRKLEVAEQVPVIEPMTAEEIVEFESEYVLWNQKTKVGVTLEVSEIGTVKAQTYRKAIELANAMLKEANGE